MHMCKSVGYVHMSISGQRGYKGVWDPVGLELQMAAVCPTLELGIMFRDFSTAESPLQPLPSSPSS